MAKKNPDIPSPEHEQSVENAETLGSLLRRTRQSKHITLADVAKLTRIHANTLKALEEDNRGALPAEVFTRGFVKIYAQFLGIAPSEALQMYLRTQGDHKPIPDEKINAQEVLASETLAESPTLITGRHIFFILLLAVLFLITYWMYKAATAPPQPQLTPPPLTGESQLGQHMPPSPAAVEGEVTPSSDQPDAARKNETADVAAPTQPASPSAPEKMTPADTSAAPKPPFPETAAKTPQPIKELAPPGPIKKKEAEKEAAPAGIPEPARTVEKKPEPEKTAATKPLKSPYILEATFREDTWLRIQVDEEKAKPVYYRAGDTVTWQATERIQLFVGNAGGVDLVLNKTKLPPLGKSGKTARLSIPPQTEQ